MRTRFHFGPYELDVQERELRKLGVRIKLQEQPFQVLLELVERPGQLVTREELQHRLWPDGTFVDFEQNLNRAVNRLRDALSDTADVPRYIETVPRHGYRFIAAVESDARPVPQARPKWKLAAGLVTAALVGVALLWALWWRRPSSAVPDLQPKRLAVAIFENRTGDPALDHLGRMAADWISEGLSRIGAVEIVPQSTVLELAGQTSKARQDPIQALAAATGAALVVSGAYYVHDHTIQLQARITDVAANKLLYAVEPISGPREQPLGAVETVRQHVTDAIAARFLREGINMLRSGPAPPRYEAYQEYLAARDAWGRPSVAVAHLKRALDIDPAFNSARFSLAAAYENMAATYGNMEELQEQAAQLDLLEQKREQLTPAQRSSLDRKRAEMAGRADEALIAARENSKIDPGDEKISFMLAVDALSANRPREAVEALKRPHSWKLVIRAPDPFGDYYYLTLTIALHMLGEHGRELTEARRGRAVYPDLPAIREYEVRALVALGRLGEANKVIDETLTLPASPPHGSPGSVMLRAAQELRAHGHREAALDMARRAAQWYRNRPGGEAAREEQRSEFGLCLYNAGQWQEARAVFSQLAGEHPDNILYQGMLGALFAQQGDTAGAQRISGALWRIKRPYLFGSHLYQCASIASLLGDKERAVSLLREAVAQGYPFDNHGYAFRCHESIDFEPLHGYPPFEELIRPKD